MKLTFVKRAGKFDELTIVREGGGAEAVHCPKQGILPHEMVHYAVESVLAHRGFLSLVRDGESADFATRGGDAEDSIERLVEAFQAEMWGGRVTAADLLDTYVHACAARGHPCAPVTPADVEAIRGRLDELTPAWSALGIDAALTLQFPSRMERGE